MFISFFILSACSSNDTQQVLTSRNRPNKPVIKAQSLPAPSPENERDVLIVSANDGIYITNLEMTFTVPIISNMLREDSNPDFSPDGNEIVYGGSDGDIYLIDRAQTWIENLTSSSSMDRNPLFSPDGKIIAFESNQNGAFGLFVMDKDGSQMRAILDSTNDVSIEGWSPDGEKIIFTEYSVAVNMVENEPVSPSYSIKTVNVNSGQIAQLVRDGQDDISKPAGPSYSPDGSMVAFQGILGGAFNIFTISPNGKNLKRITQNDSWQFNGPYWNPDGINLMVFVSPLEKDMGDSFLGLIDLNGNLIRRYDYVNGYVTSWRKIP